MVGEISNNDPKKESSRWPSPSIRQQQQHARRRRQFCRGLSNLQLTAFILVVTATIFVYISIAPAASSAQTVHSKVILPSSSSSSSSSNILSCSSMSKIKKGKLKVTFAQVNELRRHLLIENRSCFESNSQFFIKTFLDRRSANHVMLHIPKTGGTTLCKQVREDEISTQQNNCWKGSFCPMWCCEACSDPQPTPCSRLKEWPQTFVMNENYLDEYCNHHTYSILIREPVSRAISHMSHYLQFVAMNNNQYPNANMNWKFSLVMSNYMVWALSAIALFDVDNNNNTNNNTNNMIHAKDLHPDEKDLNFAKQRLMQMDYLVDLGHENTKCRDQMFTHMKIVGTNLGTTKINAHANTKPDYQRDFRRNDFAAANKLDLELYSFAQDLIDADCVFYEMIHGMQQQQQQRNSEK